MMKMNLTLFGETCQHALEPNQSNRKMTLTVKELAGRTQHQSQHRLSVG